MKRLLMALVLLMGWSWTYGGALAQGGFYVIAVPKGVGTAISSLPVEISTPGFYYLTKNLTLADGGDAITVKADHVTLDLMGFSIAGTVGSGNGIYMNGVSDVEIRNGTIHSFDGNGIHSEYSANYSGLRVLNTRVVDNIGSGVYLRSKGATVTGNGVFANGLYGILTDDGSVVSGNTVHNNGKDGIYVLSGSLVTGNTVFENSHSGINGSNATTITGNTVYKNSICGIRSGRGSTITGNAVKDNNQSDSTDSLGTGGLWVFAESIVKGNTVSDNNIHGIYVYSSGNAIEENLLTGSTGNGLYFQEAGNFYANNRASGNVVNYANTTGNTNGGGNYSF